MLISHSARAVVSQAWLRPSKGSPASRLNHKCARTVHALKLWSKEVVGDLSTQVSQLEQQITALQNLDIQQQGLSVEQHKTLLQLIVTYNSCLTRLELWWSQRAKVRWIAEGDRNTSFFHRMATQRCSTPFPAPRALISSAQSSSLIKPVSLEEIYVAAHSLASNRAPGIDGITGSFVKRFWSITHTDFCVAISKFFETSIMPLRWKDTLVVLLPNVQNAHYPHHFRPINLCTTAYKIVVKILVNRMKEILGPLIAKEQAAFVPDRNIADNCILAQEVMHRFRTSASTSGLMALKIDMEQAYKHTLLSYCEVSGQQINRAKSSIMFSQKTRSSHRRTLVNKLGFHQLRLGKYLGIPLLFRRPAKADFNGLLSKVRSQISLWGVRFLSFAGRLTLINSVLSSLPVYSISHTYVPHSVLSDIKKILRHFLWAGSSSQHRLHYVNWDTVAQPKCAGGLGIHLFSPWRKVLIAKLAGQYYSKHQSLWVSCFQAKYGGRDPIFSTKRGDSYMWRLLCHSSDLVLDNMKVKIGSGLSCAAFTDPWISTIPLNRWPTFINVLLDLPPQVSDFFHNDQWNERTLLQHFGAPLVQRIVRLPRLPTSTPDSWKALGDHRLSLGLCYPSLSPLSSAFDSASMPSTTQHLLRYMATSLKRNRNCLITHCLAAALYLIWQARNNKVHGQPFQSPRVIALQSLSQHTTVNFPNSENWDSTSFSGCFHPTSSWNPPPQHWLKINFDGAVRQGIAAVGAIIRNSEGQFLGAKGSYLSTQATDITELHATLVAVELAKPWINRVQGVWLEGDSQRIVLQLQEAIYGTQQPSLAELSDAIPILLSFQFCKISHVYRQANMAADYITSFALSLDVNWEWNTSLPSDFCAILLKDCLSCI
ncbi:Putative ribonuclease H protein [Apostasia shenzhenica]|uniref:Ribonuclease H protein n=1 Tax=Apostasia shenzhenica TaxID=1088818 RepID=A0A2I0AE79_9ASPA|nr:Putative ribonuclease H protein [Apostasia shenzhenica]